jgi:hypothetical protein
MDLIDVIKSNSEVQHIIQVQSMIKIHQNKKLAHLLTILNWLSNGKEKF